jgi:hypothetical protein
MGAQGEVRRVGRGLSADGSTLRWSVDLETAPGDPLAPALAADGTVLLAWRNTLYAIGD